MFHLFSARHVAMLTLCFGQYVSTSCQGAWASHQTLAMTPLLHDSHSVLKACTKVPLYNMRVTKINKHSPPPSPCLLLKGRLHKALLSCLMCPPVLCLTPSPAPAQHRKPPRLQQEAMLSQCAWKAKAISIVEAMFTFWVFILICSSQAGGQGANAQITWGQSAEWLGQGRCFHTQCQEAPGHKEGKAGWAAAYTRSQIPEMVSEYLPLIFPRE